MPTCSRKLGHVVVVYAAIDWSNMGHRRAADGYRNPYMVRTTEPVVRPYEPGRVTSSHE